jgi:hypothetical protein
MPGGVLKSKEPAVETRSATVETVSSGFVPADRTALAVSAAWDTPSRPPLAGQPACSRIGDGPQLRRRPGDQSGKSRVMGDHQARICESRGVRFPPATRQTVVVSDEETAS